MVRAPAKINLGLRIVGRRPDGYHELDSLFLPLDLADELELREAPPEDGVSLELAGGAPGVPADPSNLAVRAALAFAEAAGLTTGLAVRLTKRIPAAAGLGGGSSDAGAVLRELDRRHPGAVAPERLRALALSLGADVPFFLDPRPARVRGVGERVEPVEGVPALHLVLANPGIPLSTAEVYRAADALGGELTGPAGGPTMPPLSALREAGADPADPSGPGAGELEAWVRNDLEPAALRLCPPIGRLRERLRQAGARAVGLSGSGPTLYGLFGDRATATRAAVEAGIRAPAWVRVAQTLPSP